MQIATDRGKIFPAAWAEAPTPLLGRLIMEIRDARAISEIAADFEGVARVTVMDDGGDAHVHEGYTELVKVARNTAAGTAQLHFEKPKEG